MINSLLLLYIISLASFNDSLIMLSINKSLLDLLTLIKLFIVIFLLVNGSYPNLNICLIIASSS